MARWLRDHQEFQVPIVFINDPVRRARRNLQPGASSQGCVSPAGFHQRRSSEHKEELPRLRMLVKCFGGTRGHTFLNNMVLLAFDQLPPLAFLSPFIVLGMVLAVRRFLSISRPRGMAHV